MHVFPEAQHISVTIRRRAADVCSFVVNPENLPQWANGLSGSIEHVNGEWIAQSPMGKVKVRFVEQNDLGVLDHYVTLESGETVYNPMRVVANGDGAELILTLFRRPDMSDTEWEADISAVARDLSTLKVLLESTSTRLTP